MAGKITVVGLGAGDMDQLTIGIHKLLTKADTLYVRTKDHPLIEELEKKRRTSVSLMIYMKHDQFGRYMKKLRIPSLKRRGVRTWFMLCRDIRLSQKNSSAADGAAGKGKRSSESRGDKVSLMPHSMPCKLTRLKVFNLWMPAHCPRMSLSSDII